MGLFTLLNYCVSCSLEYLKSQIEFKSRPPIPAFSGYHCNFEKVMREGGVQGDGMLFV